MVVAGGGGAGAWIEAATEDVAAMGTCCRDSLGSFGGRGGVWWCVGEIGEGSSSEGGKSSACFPDGEDGCSTSGFFRFTSALTKGAPSVSESGSALLGCAVVHRDEKNPLLSGSVLSAMVGSLSEERVGRGT